MIPEPPGARKVVIATNTAETNLAIDDNVYIVDSGFVKQKVFIRRTEVESQIILPSPRPRPSREQEELV